MDANGYVYRQNDFKGGGEGEEVGGSTERERVGSREQREGKGT